MPLQLLLFWAKRNIQELNHNLRLLREYVQSGNRPIPPLFFHPLDSIFLNVLHNCCMLGVDGGAFVCGLATVWRILISRQCAEREK